MQAVWVAVAAAILLIAVIEQAMSAEGTAARSVYTRAAAKAHPRSMPQAGEISSPELTARVERRMKGGLLPQSQATEESRRAIEALRVYAASREARHYEEALRRSLHIAAWDPRGATGYTAAPEDSRTVAWTLALAYDWLEPRLDEAQKRSLLDTLRVRAADLSRDTSPDSAATLTAISTLVAGDMPEARVWLVQN